MWCEIWLNLAQIAQDLALAQVLLPNVCQLSREFRSSKFLVIHIYDLSCTQALYRQSKVSSITMFDIFCKRGVLHLSNCSVLRLRYYVFWVGDFGGTSWSPRDCALPASWWSATGFPFIFIAIVNWHALRLKTNYRLLISCHSSH